MLATTAYTAPFHALVEDSQIYYEIGFLWSFLKQNIQNNFSKLLYLSSIECLRATISLTSESKVTFKKKLRAIGALLTPVHELIALNQNLSAKESVALLYTIFLQKLEKNLFEKFAR